MARTSLQLFGHDFSRSVEGCACGGHCGGCRSNALHGLGDYSESFNSTTGVYSSDYKSGGVDPAMGTKMVLEAFSDLFTGKREKDAARTAAERLAMTQAQVDQAQLQQRALATERWTAVVPWAVMGISVIGVGIILLKASKR